MANTPGTEIVPYEPPPPMFNDTMLAFRAVSRDPWLNPSVSLHIAPDPFGGPNRILSLMRNDRDGSTRIGKSVLYPVRKGMVVSLGQDGDSWFSGPSWRELTGSAPEPYRPRVWAVTVDDKRVLEVPYGAALPDIPPRPRIPWYTRAVRAIAAERWTIPDVIAGWLGYHRAGECGGDEW